MELPVLDKFCFAFGLRSGCIVMGALNVILTFSLGLMLMTNAADMPPRAADDLSSVVSTIVALLAALLAVRFLLDIAFVYAVHKEKHSWIKNYCICWIVFLVLFIVGFLKTLFHMEAGCVIALVLFLAENFYYIVVIRSYLKSINEDGVL